jgi:hypothetical protein
MTTNPDDQIEDLPLETETADDVQGGGGGLWSGKAGQSHEGGGIAQ